MQGPGPAAPAGENGLKKKKNEAITREEGGKCLNSPALFPSLSEG